MKIYLSMLFYILLKMVNVARPKWFEFDYGLYENISYIFAYYIYLLHF